MPQYMPKTLAKTLAYILCHAPGEYGLFWDPTGTMPWKELYWALQEDPDLRFVREAHLREIAYLGIDLPVRLEGSLLHLTGDPPRYPAAFALPDRLYYACRRRQYPVIQEKGIVATNRTYLPLAASRELALRLGRRREAEPILIEVFAQRADAAGMRFLEAGEGLYLTEAVPRNYLLLPQIREEELLRLTTKKEKKPEKAAAPPTPGSFFLDPSHLPGAPAEAAGKRKGARGAQWKRASRKERNKRSV